jgi:hypothetical protein
VLEASSSSPFKAYTPVVAHPDIAMSLFRVPRSATVTVKPVIEASYGGFSRIVTELLAGAGWGWHIETAIHVIRLILGGVFDKYPKLQIVVGHMVRHCPSCCRDSMSYRWP